MSDSVSVLSRLAQERRCVAIYVPIQDPGGDWIVSVTLQRKYHSSSLFRIPTMITTVVRNHFIEAHNAGTHLLGVVAQYSGIGRAKRIKQAKQHAAHDILSKLPLRGMTFSPMCRYHDSQSVLILFFSESPRQYRRSIAVRHGSL